MKLPRLSAAVLGKFHDIDGFVLASVANDIVDCLRGWHIKARCGGREGVVVEEDAQVGNGANDCV